VVVWANKIGPFSNPQETYAFYDAMPLCPPTEIEESHYEGLGESLQGYELVKSSLKLLFKGSCCSFCFLVAVRLTPFA
jgi:hypothetical protein